MSSGAREMKEEILDIICKCLRDLNEGINSPALENANRETRLIGSHSALDSIGLVTLIADVEEAVSVHFGKDLILADDRAMSRTNSPFRRVDSLADYVIERLQEKAA
jgi:acyl carrier protein